MLFDAGSQLKELLNSGSFWFISSLFVVTRQVLLNPDRKDLKVLVGTVLLGIPLASFAGNAFFEYTDMLQLSFLITAVTALMSEAILSYFVNNDEAVVSKLIKRLLGEKK